MSTIDFPDYINSLGDVYGMFKQLDKRYGKPRLKNPKKMKGQYMSRMIIEYLAYNKQATCDDIAKEEFKKNIQTHRLEKSISDNIRKFIKNNLMYPRLVIEDGYKKGIKQNTVTYSLTSAGVLYAIYLFADIRLELESGMRVWYPTENDPTGMDFVFVRKLAKQYSHLFPKVFRRFDIFEKIIGEEYETTIWDTFARLISADPAPQGKDEMLTEHALYYFWSGELTKNGPDELIAEQFSLVFYANLELAIEMILDSRSSNEWMKKIMKNENLITEKTIRESNPIIAKTMWMKIMNNDMKLNKWYYDFVVDTIESKKIDLDELEYYRYEIHSKNV